MRMTYYFCLLRLLLTVGGHYGATVKQQSATVTVRAWCCSFSHIYRHLLYHTCIPTLPFIMFPPPFHSHMFPVELMSHGTQFVCWACTCHHYPHQINKYRVTEQIVEVIEQNK
jgi:hypothetical protein